MLELVGVQRLTEQGLELFGGMGVVLEPGGDKKMLGPGGEIEHTQGAVPLSELIAKFMFGGTNSEKK